MQSRVLRFVVPFLALGAPLYAQSTQFGIPVLRWEMLPLVIILAILSLAFGLLLPGS